MKRVFLGVLFLVSIPAHAYFVNGNELVEFMRDWERASQNLPATNYTNAARYQDYIKGVYDALHLSKVICPSAGVTVGQVGAVVAKILVANPERWSEPAFFLVSDALKGAFPCRTQ